MRRWVPCAVLLCAALIAREANADLAGARARYLRGDYPGARKELKEIGGKDRRKARLLLARVRLRVGAYEEAEKLAGELARGADPVAADSRVLLASIYRLTGRYREAIETLEAQAKKRPDHERTRYLLALAYRDVGEVGKSDALFQIFVDAEQNGKIDLDNAEQLFHVAEAGRYLQHFQYANDTYRDAVARDEKLYQANLQWGHLFLEKYDPDDAEKSFDEVLKLDPHHPDAHAGMAEVKLGQNYDLAAAYHHIQQALKANPRHVQSLLLLAQLKIDQNQWDEAKKSLAKVFAVNPNSLEGRSLMATIHWLRDDDTKYQVEKKRVFAINPVYRDFFHIIVRSAVHEHRYREAIELEKEAVKINPDDYEAMQEIGTGYLRLGREKEGLRWLEKAYQGDQYNVRTVNTLELFDEIIPKEYSIARSKDFKFRLHNEEKEALLRFLRPLLEDAFEGMVKRYGFRPKTPITIELYHNPEHYSVRTIGLPNLGALGVCFGQVITAMSPSAGDINWAMVLYHELSHVFAIQLSNSRVPRWYTEGLSEYETIMARPEWHRENDADVWGALAEGTLPSVTELNYGFMRPNMQEVVVAYHMSSITIQYIAETYGFDKVVEGLKLYGKDKETPEVIEKITGRTVPEFDAEFRRYLERRLAPYSHGFHIPASGYDDVDKLEIATGAHPDDAAVWADLALGRFYEGNAAKAVEAADKALKLDDKNKIALYVKAEIVVRTGALDEAKKLYKRLIREGGDAFDVRARLGMIAIREGDNAEAEKQLCTAKSLEPERSYPYQALADLYKKEGRTDESLAELESYVMIEEMQLGPVKRLVNAYRKRKQWPKVRTYGEMALRITPLDSEILLDLGAAYLHTGSPDRAQFVYEAALEVKPRIRRPALAHIGLAHAFVAKNQKRRALRALAKALKYEPANAEALKLKATLAGH